MSVYHPSWPYLTILSVFQTYAAVLSLLSLSWNGPASSHLTFVLLTTWITYVYRDVWPLATYYLTPADGQDALFWAKFTALSVAAVIVPLTMPRKYVPYDSQVRLLLLIEVEPRRANLEVRIPRPAQTQSKHAHFYQ